MKNLNYLFALIFFAVSLFSCEKTNNEDVEIAEEETTAEEASFNIEIPEIVVECNNDETPEPLSVDSINAYIYDQLSTNGEFIWSEVDNYFFWSAVVQGEGMVEIGYSEYSNVENMNEAEIEIIKEVATYVIQLALQHEQIANPELTEEDIVTYRDSFFTHLALRVSLPCTIEALRKDELIRFVEASYDKL